MSRYFSELMSEKIPKTVITEQLFSEKDLWNVGDFSQSGTQLMENESDDDSEDDEVASVQIDERDTGGFSFKRLAK